MAGEDQMKRYEMVKQIGKGSYGKVYLMRDKVTKELVVVKTIPIKAKDQKSKTSAMKEAKVLAMMKHPNIIAYLDSFFDQRGDFCIVLEYADGKDLQKYLANHGEVEERQVLQIFTQLILGLDYIHSQNILHRDIKTANVFLFRKGLVKLGDFGIAREVSNDELAHTLIGTPYFMCPELLRGQSYGFPADVWAAGCVLFELMARKHAFTGKSREELFANIMGGQMPEMPTQYSKELIDLLRQMLAQDPAKRPTCKAILATPIIGKGLDALQARLSRHFGGARHERPEVKHAPGRAPKTKAMSPQKQTMEETDEETTDQGNIPDWLGDNQPVGEELMRQSFRHLEHDRNRLLGVVRSSISNRAAFRPDPEAVATVPTVTGNLAERKRRLEEEAKKSLGPENYQIAYKFIKEHGQERRDELLDRLGVKSGKIPEMELHMIETLTCIEECE